MYLVEALDVADMQVDEQGLVLLLLLLSSLLCHPRFSCACVTSPGRLAVGCWKESDGKKGATWLGEAATRGRRRACGLACFCTNHLSQTHSIYPDVSRLAVSFMSCLSPLRGRISLHTRLPSAVDLVS